MIKYFVHTTQGHQTLMPLRQTPSATVGAMPIILDSEPFWRVIIVKWHTKTTRSGFRNDQEDPAKAVPSGNTQFVNAAEHLKGSGEDQTGRTCDNNMVEMWRTVKKHRWWHKMRTRWDRALDIFFFYLPLRGTGWLQRAQIFSAVWCQDTAVVKVLQTTVMWPFIVRWSHCSGNTTRTIHERHASTDVKAKTRGVFACLQDLAPAHKHALQLSSSPPCYCLLTAVLLFSCHCLTCQALPKYVFCLPVALCTQTPPSNYPKRSRQKTGLINLRRFWQWNVSQGDSVPFLLRFLHFILMYHFFFVFTDAVMCLT